MEASKAYQNPRTLLLQVAGSCLTQSWEQHLGPSEDQYVLLTAKPSLQPLNFYFKDIFMQTHTCIHLCTCTLGPACILCMHMKVREGCRVLLLLSTYFFEAGSLLEHERFFFSFFFSPLARLKARKSQLSSCLCSPQSWIPGWNGLPDLKHECRDQNSCLHDYRVSALSY